MPVENSLKLDVVFICFSDAWTCAFLKGVLIETEWFTDLTSPTNLSSFGQ